MTTQPPRQGWIVFHTGRRITVTSWYVQTPRGRYRTADLDGVFRLVTYAHPAGRVALLAGGLELAVALASAVATGSAVVPAAGLVAAVGVLAGVLADGRRGPRWLQLWGRHRGAEVLLFSSRRLDELERVRWALTCAVEENREALA